MEEIIMYGSAKSDKTSTAELEKQFRVAKEYSDLYGMKISAVYFDISNSDRVDQRHGLQEILALAAAGEARTIVVSDLAKISTNIAQVAYWLEKLNRTNTRLISRKGCGDDVCSADNLALYHCICRFAQEKPEKKT